MGRWLAPPGQWLAPPGQWLSPPGQWLAPPGEWLAPPGQWGLVLLHPLMSVRSNWDTNFCSFCSALYCLPSTAKKTVWIHRSVLSSSPLSMVTLEWWVLLTALGSGSELILESLLPSHLSSVCLSYYRLTVKRHPMQLSLICPRVHHTQLWCRNCRII